MKLHHDPANGGLPAALVRTYRHDIVEVPFHLDVDSRCGHCGEDTRVHVWQVVDPDMAEQGGVVNCAVTA